MKAIVKALAGAIVLLSLWPGAQVTGTPVVDIASVLGTWCDSDPYGANTLGTYGLIAAWDTSGANTDWTNILSVNADFSACAPAFDEDIGGWTTDLVTNMAKMFEGAAAFNRDLSDWNTASVLNMYRMFASAMKFNQDLSDWNVEKVSDMREMFMEADEFEPFELEWIVTEATDMQSMFYDADKFDPDTFEFYGAGQVTNMKRMFQGCNNFNPTTFAITGLGVVSLDMSFMFGFAYVFNSENIGSGDTPGLNTATVVNMRNMFENAYAFNQPLDQWNTALVTNMNFMFKEATSFNQQLHNWDMQSITSMEGMFWGATAFNELAPLSVWTVASSAAGVANTFANMFYRPNGVESHLTALYCTWKRRVMNVQDMICISATTCTGGTCEPTDCETWYSDPCNNVVIDINTAVADWCIFKDYDPNLGNFGLMSEWLIDASTNNDWTELFFSDSFSNCKSSFNEPIGNWNTGDVAYMSSMFSGATSFNQPLGELWPTVANVRKMDFMFEDATSLVHTEDFSWDVPLVFTTYGMFMRAIAFAPGTFVLTSAGSLTDLRWMFSEAALFAPNTFSITDLPGEGVTMEGMFYGTPFNPVTFELKRANDDSNAVITDMSYVTDMSQMFHAATAFGGLGRVPSFQWNVQRVTTTSTMFGGAAAFAPMTFKLTNAGSLTALGYMFAAATLFAPSTFSITVLPATGVSAVGMFMEAALFNPSDLFVMNTEGFVNMGYMFEGATAFNQPLDSWNTASVTTMERMFWEATAFDKYASLNTWVIDEIENAEGEMILNMFDRLNGDVDSGLSGLYCTWKGRGINVEKMICTSVGPDDDYGGENCDTWYDHDCTSKSKSGLSTGAKVGIGIGSAVVLGLIYGAVKLAPSGQDMPQFDDMGTATPFI